MKIIISGQEVNEPNERDPPFPNTSAAGKSFDGLSDGPAGSQSFMRIHFFNLALPDPLHPRLPQVSTILMIMERQ